MISLPGGFEANLPLELHQNLQIISLSTSVVYGWKKAHL